MNYGVHSTKWELMAEIGRHEKERYDHAWKLQVLAMALKHASRPGGAGQPDLWWGLFACAVAEMMLDDPYCEHTSPESYKQEIKP